MNKRRPTPPPKGKEPRINHQINSQNVRLVVDGKGTVVMSLRDALIQAEQQGLDLVEVSPDQDPPVCKIIDFGKWKFEQQKKKKEQARHQHIIHVKEIKMRPKIGTHDYDIKKVQTSEFLDKGDKVKVTMRFRGREISHPEIGMALMERLVQDLVEYAVVEAPAKMDGKQIVMVLAPKPGRKKPEKKKEVAAQSGAENLAQQE